MLCDLTLHNVICQIQFTRKRNHTCCDWITNVGIDGRIWGLQSPSATDITPGPIHVLNLPLFPRHILHLHPVTFRPPLKLHLLPPSSFRFQF